METPPKPARLRRRRIPAFHPVPVGARRDGWTPVRQAALIGNLAETRCVEAACRVIGMGKESAYRLRKRPGAAGFAAAWDAALGKPHAAVDLASAKSTGLDAGYRHRMGLLQVVIHRGRYLGTYWKDDRNALLQHLAQVDRGCAKMDAAERMPPVLEPGSASTPGPDRAGRGADGERAVPPPFTRSPVTGIVP